MTWSGAAGAMSRRIATEAQGFADVGPAPNSPPGARSRQCQTKLIAGLFLLISSAAAQSITITSPSSGAIIAGFSYSIVCSVSSISTLAYVELLVDGEPSGFFRATEPHSCPPLTWNSYDVGNGANHILQLVALNAAQQALATGAPQTNPVENWLPQQTCAFNAAPSNACTDLSVAPVPAASMKIAMAGDGVDFATNTVTFKPSGSSAPSVVGSPSIFTASGTSQASLTSPGRSISSTNNWIVAWVHWYVPNSAGIATLTDSDGNNFLGSCTSATTISTVAGEVCYLKATATHSSGYTVTATFSGAAGSSLYVYEISGAAPSSPRDVSLNDWIASGGVPLAEILDTGIPASVANEFVLFCAGWNSFQQHSATAGPNFTVNQGSYTWSACEYGATAANWLGQEALLVTVNGGNAGVAKTWNCYIDGRAACAQAQTPGVTYASPNSLYNSPSATATSLTFYVDTTGWYNGPHQVVLMASNTNGTNCPGGSAAGCLYGSWNTLAQWEQTETFSNPVLPVELTLTYRDQKAVCPGAIPSSCSAAAALSGTIHFTDGSTAAATSLTAGTPVVPATDVTAASISCSGSSCSWSPLAIGSISASITEGTYGLSRVNWFNVVAANNYPNVGNDATIQAGYVAGNTSIMRSMFRASPCLLGFTSQGDAFPGYTAAQCAADFAAGGWNVAEQLGLSNPPSVGGYPNTEAAWDAQVQSDINTACAVLTNGLHVGFQADGWVGYDTPFVGLYSGLRGYAASFATPPLQYIYQQWGLLCPQAFPRWNEMKDEVTYSSITPSGPVPCGTGNCTIGSSGGPSQIACVVSTTCTVTWPSYQISQGAFVISGSGTGLDYNTSASSPTPAVYILTNINGNSFTFPNPGVGSVTYTAASNNCGSGGTSSCTTLQIAPFATDTEDATGQICDKGQRTGPCIDWPRYDAFLNYHAQARAGNAKALLSYAPRGADGSYYFENQWCGNANVADVCDLYDAGGIGYIPTANSINALISTNGDPYRASLGNLFATKPTSILAPTYAMAYALNGYPVAVTSINGQTITTATPHQLANVFNGISRLWVTGATSGNGEYYVASSPTGMQLNVVQVSTISSSATGTITFSGGAMFAGVTLGPGSVLNDPHCSTDGLKNYRGQTFTSSTGNASFDNSTWWYGIENPDSCQVPYGEQIYQVPSLTSTGGTAYVIADNNAIPGRNWFGGAEGPRAMFAGLTYPIVLGACCTRSNYMGRNTQGYNRAQTGTFDGMNTWAFSLRQVFNDGPSINLEGEQAGPHPHWDTTGNNKLGFACSAYANLLTQRLVAYEFQPSLSSPDYGAWYEAAVRRDAGGDTLLMIQQFANNGSTLAVNLSPYLVNGQQIVKYVASCDAGIVVSTLPAGTTSDTVAGPSGWFVAYLFAQNTTGVLSQPSISVSLSDVTGAAQVQVLYSYSPFPFDQQNALLPQVKNCGTGACTLPVDRNIGPIYFQTQYLDTNGRILATGPMEQL